MSTLPVTIYRPSDLAVQDSGNGFQQFFQQARHAPMLSADEEYNLAIRCQQQNDLEAAHELIRSHLRLVLKTARDYLNYQMNFFDLIQEGTIGLMQAVKKFDPYRGTRLATYAIWWIRAAIHDFIIRSWRIVKIATTHLKRQFFFKLRQAKATLAPLNYSDAKELAAKFETDVNTILEMDCQMSAPDTSLNQPLVGSNIEMIELVADQRPSQEYELLSCQQKEVMGMLLHKGVGQLNARERAIISERFLTEKPATLDILSKRFSVSRERIRQIETKALEKLREYFQAVPEAEELNLGVAL